jgi:hypothetical protein
VVYLHSALAKDWIQAAGRQERQTLLIYSKRDCNTGLGGKAATTRTGSHGTRVHGRETGQWHEANLAVAHRSGRGGGCMRRPV